MKRHDGDCTVYASLDNGNATDGICTCGFKLERIRNDDLTRDWPEWKKNMLQQSFEQKSADLSKRTPDECKFTGFHDFASDDWVSNHWGGFSYLTLRNEDFCLDFKDGCLWLHFECIDGDSIGRLLLKRNATKDDIISAEKFFGVGSVD